MRSSISNLVIKITTRLFLANYLLLIYITNIMKKQIIMKYKTLSQQLKIKANGATILEIVRFLFMCQPWH